MKKDSRKCASKGMASHELLREVFKKPGAKNVAAALNLSLSLIHQWSRPREGRSDAMNPLDRVEALMQFTGDTRLAQWVCERADGYFVLNPQRKASSTELMSAENEAMRGFGELLAALACAATESCISVKNAAVIRSRWEALKGVMEGFVGRCESGHFHRRLRVMV